MVNQNQEDLKEFFKLFNNIIKDALIKNLDDDICSNIQFDFQTCANVRDAETILENKAIYKIDYAGGTVQSDLIVLFPEELLAFVSDILTGGNGDNSYKGSLSEIETNAVDKVLDKLFRKIEQHFKQKYEKDLIFSSSSQFLLKEMDEYGLGEDSTSFDFMVSYTLKLNDEKEYQVNLIMKEYLLTNLLTYLGLTKASLEARKNEINSINMDCLSDVKIDITAELGRTQVPIKYALELVRDSLIELDTQNNSDIKVLANGVEFAYAQVVAVEDNFGLKITKIISPEERMGIV